MRKSQRQIVDACEALLERAKAGEVSGLLVAAVSPGQGINTCALNLNSSQFGQILMLAGHSGARQFFSVDSEGPLQAAEEPRADFTV